MLNNKKEMRKWEIENALNTLQRAEEIKSNTSLMRDVKKAAKTQANKLMKLGGPVNKTKKKAKKTIKRKK